MYINIYTVYIQYIYTVCVYIYIYIIYVCVFFIYMFIYTVYVCVCVYICMKNVGVIKSYA